MNKLLTLIAVAIILPISVFATEGPYKVKDLDISAGLGIGTYESGDISIPPIGISVEYGFHELFSVGGYLGYLRMGEDFFSLGDKMEWSYSHTIVAARGSMHFNKWLTPIHKLDGLDIYTGVMIGFDFQSVNLDYDGPSNPYINDYDDTDMDLLFSVHAGAKYMFNENWGAFAELGYGIAYLTVGLNYKM